MEKIKPDYRSIYTDLINEKFPEKKQEYLPILCKENFTMLDVIKLNQRLFNKKDKEILNFNQQHRSYDRKTILEILDYQKKQKLNNTQLANHFKLSRNTIAKWKKIYNIT
ncbi:transposase [Chryseobacterium sp. FH2]|uniref:transposase n=1 Tax=Chryseobacterium sp. FH2 TaxID=1674291 RepID=UPI00065AAE26|nr:transposase [Chryseobacterium sp. FH2]KMQ69187.1 transposase [Chryseobacterium sp. FH2]